MPNKPQDPQSLMHQALTQAKKSPPKPTNYCVGALLINQATQEILSTGYTLELPGNTHAEQCCLAKYAAQHNVPEERVSEVLPPNTAIYTTMEPCNFRLSGNAPCVERIIQAKRIRTVYLGVKEPEKFVGENEGRGKLEECGIECVHVPGLEGEILEVATAGHEKGESE
ncbi:cytidine deaminase-like protein [Massarina eburnea CBS 473.64]|uniref:Cytidine deaminase-like protein n=1 Tax=Massarina eburnea CBS 473.64 TaxID=1395130 RepID=A0A6A6RJV6_9PLEO|nr:cytidine deaminase-like protein [Massarina eburnea CBS 473.64]